MSNLSRQQPPPRQPRKFLAREKRAEPIMPSKRSLTSNSFIKPSMVAGSPIDQLMNVPEFLPSLLICSSAPFAFFIGIDVALRSETPRARSRSVLHDMLPKLVKLWPARASTSSIPVKRSTNSSRPDAQSVLPMLLDFTHPLLLRRGGCGFRRRNRFETPQEQ